MSRVITSLSFDLQMIVGPGSSPPCSVSFTDVAPDGHESAGRVVLVDAAAAEMWAAADKIATANTLLDAKAAALPDLPSIAARMTAVNDLDVQMRAKLAEAAAIDAQIAAKRAALATLVK